MDILAAKPRRVSSESMARHHPYGTTPALSAGHQPSSLNSMRDDNGSMNPASWSCSEKIKAGASKGASEMLEHL